MASASRPEKIYRVIGERLRVLREIRRISQEEIGLRLRPPQTRTNISNIEAGRSRVMVHTVVQLCAILRVRPEVLLRMEMRGRPPRRGGAK